MTSIERKNIRLGTALTLLVVGLVVYSFLVIAKRGKLPEPDNLSKGQRIFRGL